MFTPGPAAPPDGAAEGRSVSLNNNQKSRKNSAADITCQYITHGPDTIIPLLDMLRSYSQIAAREWGE
jgi:hypothetical protein